MNRTTHQIYSAKDLLALRDDPDRWIVENMLPRVGKTLVFGKGGTFKCRAAGQRVTLADGSHPEIQTLEGRPGLRILSFDESTGRLVPATALVLDNGEKAVMRIQLDSGRVLRVTLNEPLMTPTGWQVAEDLVPGEFLHAVAQTPEPVEPEALPSDLAYILGVMVGDGSCSTPGVARLTCGDQDLLDGFTQCASKLGYTVKQIKNTDIEYGISGGLGRLLRDYDLSGTTSHTKRVPAAIFRASVADVADFLGGYWDADGTHVKGAREVSYTSCNEALLCDVQSLLLRIGCPSLLRPFEASCDGKVFPAFRLTVDGVFASRFIDTVRTYSSKAAKAKRAIGNLARTGYEARTERIPAQAVRGILRPIGQRFLKQRLGVSFDYKPYATWTRAKVKRIATALAELAAQPRDGWPRTHSPARHLTAEDLKGKVEALRRLTDRTIWWDRIVSAVKEDQPVQTWALSCPEHSTYVCEDIVSHNTTIIFDLCVALSSKSQLLRQFPINKFGPVLVISTEGSVYENKSRLMAHARAHAVNPAEIPLYFCQQPFLLDDALDVEELEHLIRTLEPILIVLDPLDSFFSGDENSSKETKALRRTIDRLVSENETSFIIIHHETKGKDPTPRGSSAWYGWADAILHVKTWKKKLGLPDGETEIVTVESLKQRNGPKGHVFSAVPRNDPLLKQVTFSFYKDTDHAGVVLEYWKHACYQVLRDATEPMTNAMIAETLNVRPEKILQALAQLEQDGLADKNAQLARSFGPDSSRTRYIPAWRALKKISLVDLAEYMVKEEALVLEEELTEFSVTPQSPEADANTSDGSRVRPA